MKTNLSHRVVVAALFVLLSSAGLADPVTGTPPLGSYAGGPFDSVNLANLNVSFSIPHIQPTRQRSAVFLQSDLQQFGLESDSTGWCGSMDARYQLGLDSCLRWESPDMSPTGHFY